MQSIPVVIIAHNRSGSTFLCDAFSRDPEIFCWRYEPLDTRSIWMAKFRNNIIDVLDCLLHPPSYLASVVKLTYKQALAPNVLKYLKRLQPKVLFLSRKDLLAQAVSQIIVKMVHAGLIERPIHAKERSPKPLQMSIQPSVLLKQLRALSNEVKKARNACTAFRHVFEVFYEDLLGECNAEFQSAEKVDADTARQLYDFIGIRPGPMITRHRKVNPGRLWRTLNNWAEIEEALAQTEFGGLLSRHRKPEPDVCSPNVAH